MKYSETGNGGSAWESNPREVKMAKSQGRKILLNNR